MSLDNIQLPELVVRDLFKNSLVDLKTDNTAPTVSTGAIAYLGENSRKVTIIVSDKEALYLADDSLQFLLGIMTACKLSMADIALVNMHHYPDLDYTALNEQLAAEKVLLFGVGPAQLKLPMQFPDYQVQQYNRQVYLAAPALTFLEKNKEEKKEIMDLPPGHFPQLIMDTLIFATNNLNKIAEIKSALGDRFTIITLREAGIDIDIPEPHDTLDANASEKSGTIYRLTHKNCFSEDTGLEVTALNGEPGVKSARYAGENANAEENIDKLLHNLRDINERTARFRTVISLLLDGKEHFFEGICEGRISTERRGSKGFGYDPIFIPDGDDRSFAEMDIETKNRYSHRKKALEKLIHFLNHR